MLHNRIQCRREKSLVLLTQSKVTFLGVHVVVLLVAPRVNEVADDERNA